MCTSRLCADQSERLQSEREHRVALFARWCRSVARFKPAEKWSAINIGNVRPDKTRQGTAASGRPQARRCHQVLQSELWSLRCGRQWPRQTQEYRHQRLLQDSDYERCVLTSTITNNSCQCFKLTFLFLIVLLLLKKWRWRSSAKSWPLSRTGARVCTQNSAWTAIVCKSTFDVNTWPTKTGPEWTEPDAPSLMNANIYVVALW